MELYFCNVCNESIPQTDIDSGRAVARGKGVVCRACESAMSPVAGTPTVAAPATPTPKAVRTRGLWFATVLLAGAAVWLWSDQQRLAGEHARELRQLQQQLEALRGQERSANATLESLRTQHELSQRTARTETEATARRLEDVRNQLADARAGQAALTSRLAQMEAERAKLALLEALSPRLQDLEGKVRALGEERTTLLARIDDLQKGVEDVATRPTLQPTPVQPARPAWESRLADLESPGEATRLEAVLALSSTREAAVVPHLVPRMKDDNLFVRTATARALGELKTNDRAALLAMCDALLDAEAPVREAAWVALRVCTGSNLAYDPLGTDTERARRAKAWRELLERTGAPEAPLSGS
jgi:hypothetical protein